MHLGVSQKTCSCDAELANQAEDTQAARQFIDFRTGGPLPMVAERVKWKCAPSFNPKPYLSPFLNLAYEQPDVLRRPSDQWPRMTPAKLHCSREELLRLGRKLDEFGAVRVFDASLVNWPEAVGLFCVSKSATHDRLIINPTVCNSRSYTVSRYSKTLAPGSLLCLLHLGPTVAFRYSADDLSDYYYSYKISNARALRNSFRCRFDPSEVMDFRDAQGRDLVGPQVLALNTLAMGDNLAVEVGQAAHFQVLRQHACALHPDQTLLYRHVVPQGDSVEMLSIDDHICLQKVPLVDIAQKPQRRDTIIFDKATTAYKLVGLNLNDDKKRRDLTKGVLLGAEIDGVLGVVGPPRDRTLCLALLTALVAKRGHCTRELLERLLGSWIHAVMFRRPVFAVLDQLFREGLGKPRNLVFRLSDQAKNELLMLSCLASTLLTDLRASYDPRLYCLDASPQGGAVCAAQVGSSASEQFWRHGELRGYHTRLQSEVSALLSEKGIAHASQDLFGATTGPPPELLNQPSLDPLVPRPLLHEGILYDAVVFGSTSDAWGQALQGFGLKVLFKGSSARASHGERLDFGSGLFHELASLAARRVVREWHWSRLFSTFGTLRKPRRRSALCPWSNDTSEPDTARENAAARRLGLLCCLVVRCGQWVAIAQPACSTMFGLHVFKTLGCLGCVLTTVCYCAFGSPWQQRVKLLHNKPWLCALESRCECGPHLPHWRGTAVLDAASATAFNARCLPSAEAVFGRQAEKGESLKDFAEQLPQSLSTRLGSGSVAASRGHVPRVPSAVRIASARALGLSEQHDVFKQLSVCEEAPERQWFEDPEWIGEVCKALPFKELFRYRFTKPGHINVNEARVFKSWVKSVARSSHRVRSTALLDSRVTIGAAAKGRSSSFAISRILHSSLGYVLGGGLYFSLLHCYSEDNVADAPSRGRDVAPPVREEPGWLTALLAGDARGFEAVTAAARVPRVLGRWVRLLLLLAGDVERKKPWTRAA